MQCCNLEWLDGGDEWLAENEAKCKQSNLPQYHARRMMAKAPAA
jgi:hypothetical protein